MGFALTSVGMSVVKQSVLLFFSKQFSGIQSGSISFSWHSIRGMATSWATRRTPSLQERSVYTKRRNRSKIYCILVTIQSFSWLLADPAGIGIGETDLCCLKRFLYSTPLFLLSYRHSLWNINVTFDVFLLYSCP